VSAIVTHRDLQGAVEAAKPYLDLARWIFARIAELRAGQPRTVDAAKRRVAQFVDQDISALVRGETTDWLLVADTLLAESIRILQARCRRGSFGRRFP